jgi:ribosomal protein L34E
MIQFCQIEHVFSDSDTGTPCSNRAIAECADCGAAIVRIADARNVILDRLEPCSKSNDKRAAPTGGIIHARNLALQIVWVPAQISRSCIRSCH